MQARARYKASHCRLIFSNSGEKGLVLANTPVQCFKTLSNMKIASFMGDKFFTFYEIP